MSKYKIECEYSDGSKHEKTDFEDLEDLQKSADAYRYLFEKQEKLKSNGQTIDMYYVYYDGMMIECNGEFARNF